MIPFSDEEYRDHLALYGTVFTLTRLNEGGKIECFILANEEVMIKELQNDKQELR